MPSDIIHAPFTRKQVDALNRYQTAGAFHPYTCGNDAYHTGHRPSLVATTAGWACPDPECGYTQNWAHALSLKPIDPLLP